MKQLLLFLFLLSITVTNAQIVGKVTDTKGEPLPFVNIYLSESYTGTTSNEVGNYSLSVSETTEINLVFQFFPMDHYIAIGAEVQGERFSRFFFG